MLWSANSLERDKVLGESLSLFGHILPDALSETTAVIKSHMHTFSYEKPPRSVFAVSNDYRDFCHCSAHHHVAVIIHRQLASGEEAAADCCMLLVTSYALAGPPLTQGRCDRLHSGLSDHASHSGMLAQLLLIVKFSPSWMMLKPTNPACLCISCSRCLHSVRKACCRDLGTMNLLMLVNCLLAVAAAGLAGLGAAAAAAGDAPFPPACSNTADVEQSFAWQSKQLRTYVLYNLVLRRPISKA